MARSKTPITDSYIASLIDQFETYAKRNGRWVGEEWVPMSDSAVSRELFGWQDFAARLRHGKINLQTAREFEEKCAEKMKMVPRFTQPKP